MTTPADDEAREVQQRRAEQLLKGVMCLQEEHEDISCMMEKLRAHEAQLVQRHADVSNDDYERARLEAEMKAMATEVEAVQQQLDALEAEIRSCDEQLREARETCGE